MIYNFNCEKKEKGKDMDTYLIYNPATESAFDYKKRLYAWICCDEIQELIKAFGGKIPCNLPDLDMIEWMVGFSDIWDFRKKQSNATDVETKEKARWMIEEVELSQDQKCLIERVIRKLGLIGKQEPLLPKYDYIIALGGARMSCYFRTKYALEIAQRHKQSEPVVLLASMRKIADSEREATDTYAPGAVTEYDLMNGAVERLCSYDEEYTEKRHTDDNPNLSWAVREGLDLKDGRKIFSLAAPSGEADRRANSADTFQFLVEQLGLEAGQGILLVTSQIYVPYQHIEAVRLFGIPKQIKIDTVGFPVEWNQNNRKGMMTYENYLQEIRSSLQALCRLWKL